MKRYFKFIPLLLMGMMFAQKAPPTPATPEPPSAYPPPPPPHISKEERMKKLMETIDLTAEQKEKIEMIDDSFEEQEEQIKAQMKILMDQRKELMKAKKAEIDQVLTPEQKEKLKELRQNKRMERKQQFRSNR